jgi:hypothetical protein
MKKVFFYLVPVLLLVIASCKKEKLATTYVPAYLKQMLPYTDQQELRFARVPNPPNPSFNAKVKITSYISEQSACMNCPPNKRIEYIRYRFYDGNRSFAEFTIDNRPYIFLSIMSPLDNYNIGAGFDFSVTEGVAVPVCNGPRQTCIGSITLNGVAYSNVLEVISGSTAPNELTKAYYTVEKGLIGFKYGSGETFNLLQ